MENMYYLTKELAFPDVSQADKEGLLAVGGDLSIERLLLAYKCGIFPWFDDGQPILWWSPDPRFILFPEKLKVSKSMRQFMRNCDLRVTVNKAFGEVMQACADIYRPGQYGTWISDEMIVAYTQLYELGYAKSVEVWRDDKLVAGLYGIDMGNGVFCGESMFSTISNGSKAGFITFIQNTDYKIIDCQVPTHHLESLGAEEIPRDEFLKYL